MVGSKAASSVKVTIPESGNFVKKAGPCFQPSFVDRHAIYYGNCPHTEFGCRTTQHVLGAGLFPAGFNVIIGVVTLGWLEGSFTDKHSSASLQFERTRYHVDKLKVVLHVTAATILSFIMFITLSILYVLFPSHKALFNNNLCRLWCSRDAPLPSVHPVRHLLQTLLIVLIFGGEFLPLPCTVTIKLMF